MTNGKRKGGYTGNYSDGTYVIGINKNFREKENRGRVLFSARSTLLHEVQHVIQGLDKRVRGVRRNDVEGQQ